MMLHAAEMDHLIGTLKDGGLCKDVHYKELYIPQAELEGRKSVTQYCCFEMPWMLQAAIVHAFLCMQCVQHSNGLRQDLTFDSVDVHKHVKSHL